MEGSEGYVPPFAVGVPGVRMGGMAWEAWVVGKQGDGSMDSE